MVDEFGVTRKRLRRWVRSCEGSAFRKLRSGDPFTGIFILETQATLLDLFIDFKACPSEAAKQKLRDELPPKLLEPLHYRGKDPAIPINTAAKKARKRCLEIIKRARQRVRWSDDRQEYFADFVVRQDLNAEIDFADAEYTWKNKCFGLECKNIVEFPEPVTQAEAYAAWANQRYSADSCANDWNQHPVLQTMSRRIDEDSRTRIRKRLKTEPVD